MAPIQTWPQKLIKWQQFKMWPKKSIKWHQKLINGTNLMSVSVHTQCIQSSQPGQPKTTHNIHVQPSMNLAELSSPPIWTLLDHFRQK